MAPAPDGARLPQVARRVAARAEPEARHAAGRAAVRSAVGARDGLGGVESYLGSPRTRVAAQAKHYAMYGAAGKDGYTPFGGGISARTLFDVYLRPWREFAQAGGRGVMASHNLVDWTPMHANKPLLADALRGRFGLGEGGYIGSDNTNVEGLSYYLHGFAANASDAARMAIAAGVDQDMPGAEYLQLAGLVRSGVVPLSHVDRAASNVLRKKFASRLFDLEPDPTLARERDSPEARDLARRAAEEGSVLLINRNGILPLGNASAPLRRVALVGPFALDGPITEQAMLGGYSPGVPPKGVVTIGQALKRRGIHVDAAAGCGAGVGGPHVAEEDFAKAVALAAAPDTDAVIVVLGTTSCGCCVKCGNGEAGDRMSLEPEGRQLELLAAVINATLSWCSSTAAPCRLREGARRARAGIRCWTVWTRCLRRGDPERKGAPPSLICFWAPPIQVASWHRHGSGVLGTFTARPIPGFKCTPP